MKSKAYFQYYETFEVILEKIKDDVKRDHLRRQIIRYGLYGVEPSSLTEVEEMAWTICKELIDQQRHRRETNAANAAGKHKPQAEPQHKTTEKKKFVKPTIEEIQAYCNEHGYNTINAQHFFNYYESNGWKVGRNAMKSWQATIQSWSTRDKSKPAGTMWNQNSADAATQQYENMFEG